MKPAVLTVAALAALAAACTQAPADKAEAPAAATVQIADALCRPTPNGRDMTGCYLTLTASTDDRLVSVASAAAGEGQIHEMKTENGMMSMAELTGGLPLPAGQAVSLAPGGNHIMLMGLTRPLAEGETVVMTLTFEKAPSAEVTARVAQPALPGAH